MSNTKTLRDENLHFKIEIKDLKQDLIIENLWSTSESSETKFKNIISLSFVSLLEFKKSKIISGIKFFGAPLYYSTPKINPYQEWLEGVSITDLPPPFRKLYNVRVKYNNEYKYYKFNKEDLYYLISIFGLHVNFPKILEKNGFPLLESTYSYRKNKLKEECEFSDENFVPLFSDID